MRIGLMFATLALLLAAAACGTACDISSCAAGAVSFVLTLPWTVGQLMYVWWLLRTQRPTYPAALYITASVITVVGMVSAVLAARSSSTAAWKAPPLLVFVVGVHQVLLPAMKELGVEFGVQFFSDDVNTVWAAEGGKKLWFILSGGWAAALRAWASSWFSAAKPSQVVPTGGHRIPAELDSLQ